MLFEHILRVHPLRMFFQQEHYDNNYYLNHKTQDHRSCVSLFLQYSEVIFPDIVLYLQKNKKIIEIQENRPHIINMSENNFTYTNFFKGF